MTQKYFGTDGVRGTANSGAMTPDMVLRIGLAAGTLHRRGNHRHRVVIGKDTRLSGYMIEPALTAGFIGAGMDVLLSGPLPTPAIAMLTRSMRADLGVMISASHNPFEDNGIKLFGPDGYKLYDDIEIEIEKLIEGDLSKKLAKSAELGRAKRIDGVQVEVLTADFNGRAELVEIVMAARPEVFGHNIETVRRLTGEACDMVCQIPPSGKGVGSLNVSVAAGILISKLA